MTYAELKRTRQAKHDELFEAVGLFWAFSSDQFNEGREKHPLAEGMKYLAIGAGGYIPGQHKQAYIDGMDAIYAWEKQAKAELKESRAESDNAILHELNNYEAFYSGEIEDTYEALGGAYTRAEIRKVYKKNVGKFAF